MSTREFLDGITTDEKLKCVLNYCWGDFGSPPSDSPLFMNSVLFQDWFLRSKRSRNIENMKMAHP